MFTDAIFENLRSFEPSCLPALSVSGASPASGDTTLDRIGRLVAEAQAQRSPAERWVTRFAQVYTPIVIGLAVAVAVIPTVTGLLSFDDAFYDGLARTVSRIPERRRTLGRIFATALVRHPGLLPVVAKYFA